MFLSKQYAVSKVTAGVQSAVFRPWHNHFQSINQSQLVGDVAVPVSVRQAVLFWALRSPDARPRLNLRRSSSTVLSQVCLGRPGRHLQFLGAGDMQACRAREWSWDLSARATWPNNFILPLVYCPVDNMLFNVSPEIRQIHVCEVATAVIETTQLVLSQF